MIEEGRNEKGQFTSGNKFNSGRGRQTGAKNIFTQTLEALQETGYTVGQATVAIAQNRDGYYTPELVAKADGKLLDITQKAAAAEPEPDDKQKMTEDELYSRLNYLMGTLNYGQGLVVVPRTELEEFRAWKASKSV